MVRILFPYITHTADTCNLIMHRLPTRRLMPRVHISHQRLLNILLTTLRLINTLICRHMHHRTSLTRMSGLPSTNHLPHNPSRDHHPFPRASRRRSGRIRIRPSYRILPSHLSGRLLGTSVRLVTLAPMLNQIKSLLQEREPGLPVLQGQVLGTTHLLHGGAEAQEPVAGDRVGLVLEVAVVELEAQDHLPWQILRAEATRS